MRRFYKPSLWIPQHFLVTNPNLHHGLLGQVTVASGTEEMAKRIERVLTNDPGIGVARHVDAGYDEAKDFALGHAVKIPMMH
jgi:urocanate hydratase